MVFDSPVPYQEVKERAVNIQLQDISVPTISIEDLIIMKSVSSRKQDVSDIEHLQGLKNK